MTHKTVSLIKSAIRLATCAAATTVPQFAFGFALAELLGIVEELADKRPEKAA